MSLIEVIMLALTVGCTFPAGAFIALWITGQLDGQDKTAAAANIAKALANGGTDDIEPELFAELDTDERHLNWLTRRGV